MAERFIPSKVRQKLPRIGASFALLALHIAGTHYILDNDFSFTDPTELESEIEVVSDAITYRRSEFEYPHPLVIHLLTISDITRVDFLMDPDVNESDLEVTAKTVLEFMRENEVAVALNGSFFIPFRKAPRSYPGKGDPIDLQGQVIWQGEVLSEPQEGFGVFCIDSEGRSSLVDFSCPSGTQTAFAGKQLLVYDGEIVDDLDSEHYHPRTIIGMKDERVTFMIVEGRISESVGMTLEEAGQFMADMGMEYALELDGGGSSALAFYIDGEAVVVNRQVNSRLGALRHVFPVGIRVPH